MAWWKNVFTAFVCVSVPFLALTLCNAQDDATLQESDDTLSIFESRINALIEENIVLKKKLKDFDSGLSSVQRGAFSGADTKSQKLQEENQSLSGELEKKDKEIVALQKQLANLKESNQDAEPASKSKLKSLEAEVQSLRAQRDESSKENASLRGQLEKAKDEIAVVADLQSKLKSLEDAAQSLRTEIEESSKEKSELRGQMEKAKGEIAAAASVSEAFNKLQEENKELRENVAALQEANSAQALERTMLEAMLRRHPQGLKPPQPAGPDEGNFDVMIHTNLGFAYAMKENIDEAVREYQQALSANPEDKDIHYNLGYLLNKQNNYSEAIKEYSQALKGTPQDQEIYYNVALIYALGLKDVKTAEEYHQKFLSLASPDSGSSSPVEEAGKAK